MRVENQKGLFGISSKDEGKVTARNNTYRLSWAYILVSSFKLARRQGRLAQWLTVTTVVNLIK